ncbi:MAG: hypothetical protein ABSC47_03545, partial [Terracidiphilus sp.]
MLHPFRPPRRMRKESGLYQGTTKQAAEKLFGMMTVTDFCQDLIYQRTMRGNDQKQEAMFSYLT